VEPIRSQSITLRGRRSAVVKAGAGAMAAAVCSDRTRLVCPPASIGAPQSAQNFAPAGEEPPQAPQAAGNAIPHAVQNRLSPIVSAPQPGQVMDIPPMSLRPLFDTGQGARLAAARWRLYGLDGCTADALCRVRARASRAALSGNADRPGPC
jgi:hypothetical protein